MVRLEPRFLEGDALVPVVGESHYQNAIRHACGSDRWEDIRFDCIAALVPEPSNPYDPNAVIVQVAGERVGYLSREDAVAYGGLVGRLADQGRAVVCAAMIAGRGPGSDTPNLGVFLHLPPPDEEL